MNGNDTYLDVNNAHLRVTSGNVHASGFNLDQISIVTTSNTGSTINFLNDTKGFMSRSNIEVGTANLFVDTTTSRVGIGTDAPAYTLDVHGSANVGTITTTDINVTGNLTVLGTTTTVDTDNLRVKDPIIELGKDNAVSPVVDLGLILTRPTGSSNVAIIYDESTDNLEIGYTQGNASQSIITMETAAANPISVNVNGTISGNGSGLTALPAAQITGTLDVARIPALDTAKITTGTLDAARIPTLNQNTTGSAGSATTAGTAATLTTARTIGGVDFDGSEAIVPTTFNGATFNGDVGIGTTTPQQKLEVHGNILLGQNDVASFIHNGANMALSSDLNVLIVSDANLPTGVPDADIIFGAGSAINMDTNRDFTFAQAYPSSVPRLEYMRIVGASGNVGIGTTTPTEALQVYRDGSDPTYIQVVGKTSDRAGIIFSEETADKNVIMEYDGTGAGDGNYLAFYSALSGWTAKGAGLNFVPANGRVGIGTTTPGSSLHVNLGNAAGEQHIRATQTSLASSSKAGIRFGDSTWDAFIDHDHGDKDRMNFGFYRNPTREVQMVLTHEGNVGIGATTPGNKLHVYGGTDSLFLQKSSTAGGVGIKFSDTGDSGSQLGFLRYYHQNTESTGLANCFRLSTDQDSETLVLGGCLHVGFDGKDGGVGGIGRKNLFIQSTYGGNTSQNYGWWMGAQNATLSSGDNDLYFSVVRNGTLTTAAYVQDDATDIRMNFTGQHRTFVKGVPTKQLEDKEGLIVIADQNEFIKMSGGVAYGNDAITVNESLPVVSFSTKAKDKRCFGVISTTEDPETRKEVYGNFGSFMHKEDGDTRVYVNSVGEGGIWVVNTEGTLESGDYITTSNVSAYGMKQDDDLLHNYTVAKILMDCDFNPTTQPKRIIKKEAKMIDYWIRYGDVKITEEEYATLPETKRKIIEDVHYRIDQMDVLKEDPEKDSFVYEQREDMVNVLDEHGEFQWEDTDETEKAYKIRYLDANGDITDEANAVHTAAFVGCTYHCG